MGGSTAISMTGQYGMRLLGATFRAALIEFAAEKLNVPEAELTTANSTVMHAASGKSATYGELAADAASRTLQTAPTLKTAATFTIIGTSPQRHDIPRKVTGEAIYGIDFTLPEMRIATIMAAPVRGGALLSVDEAPALAISGVEQVIKLDHEVAVVAKGYWPAIQGLRALSPKFSDAGLAGISTASIYEQQETLLQPGTGSVNAVGTVHAS